MLIDYSDKTGINTSTVAVQYAICFLSSSNDLRQAAARTVGPTLSRQKRRFCVFVLHCCSTLERCSIRGLKDEIERQTIQWQSDKSLNRWINDLWAEILVIRMSRGSNLCSVEIKRHNRTPNLVINSVLAQYFQSQSSGRGAAMSLIKCAVRALRCTSLQRGAYAARE